jgi:nucleoside-diphosphate kinase
MPNKEKNMPEYKELTERTVVLIKPDGVMRGLVGEILSRFEKAGYKLVGLKMVKVDHDFAKRHLPMTDEWIKGLGQHTIDDFKKYGRNLKKEMGTEDGLEIGKMIAGWLIDYLSSGPIVAIALEGNHAIEIVRKMIGNTLPVFAMPGTIRGDFSKDSPALANAMKRAIRNVVHASGNAAEAKNELELWFGPEDIRTYERIDWAAMFGEFKGGK